jgi:hypothetical protein
VAQAYPSGVKWLKEGIADYIRYYVLFPDPRRPLPPGLTYQVGYLPAAAMLDWASRRYSRTLVRDVNAAMRAGHDGEGALAQITGQTPQGLWAAFTASRAAAAKKAA